MRSLTLRFLVLLAALLSSAAVAAEGKDRIDAFADTLFSTNTFSQVALAPDGASVAWVEPLHDAAGQPTEKSAIYVADPRSPQARRRITAIAGAEAEEGHVAWAPDSRRLVFLSDAASPGQAQIYLADLSASVVSPRRLTDLKGFLTAPSFSPDGRTLAFLYTAGSARVPGPTRPTVKDAGVVEETIVEQRIAVLDASSRTATSAVLEASPADLYVYEYDWMPDGKGFAAIAAHGSGDDNWWLARLYTIAAGGALREIWKPELQIAVPRVSPDGRSVAVISGLMSDEGLVGGDVFTVPTAGGPARNLTPGRAASATWLTWLPDGRLLWSEIADGHAAIARTNPSGGAAERLWSGDEALVADEDTDLSLSLSRDGTSSAAVRSGFSQAPEIWVGPLGAWRQVTHENDGRAPQWGRTESVHWTSDGRSVQGWLFHPRNETAGEKYPLVVWVHGGPSSAATPRWPTEWTYGRAMPLSDHGYFVLYPNPRGSYGQGEDFTRGNVRDFGGGDLRDILAGVEEVVKSRPVDPQRVGIGGWSYGGFMTMWAITQTNRFKAAMAGAGIANWLSYYGQNRIDTWMIPFFGASVYDNPEIYEKISPIHFVKQVKTPTLIMVGDSDAEVPSPQSYELWHALKALGVPTQLVVFPGEGHSIRQPQNRRELMRRMLGWFDRYLQER